MNATAVIKPAPTREDLAALAVHVTGAPALVRALWDEVRGRSPELKTRPDIGEDFLVDALVEAADAGLLEELLFELAAQRLTDGKPYMEAATELVGRPPFGSLSPGDLKGADQDQDLLLMEIGGPAPDPLEAMPTLKRFQTRFQTFLPKNAEETVIGKGRAMDRVCRIVIDGKTRGSGVLVNDFIIATSAHVVEPLVEAGADGEFRPREGALKRLELHFPRGRAAEHGLASPAREWLVYFSPTADSERVQPFAVYDVHNITADKGPWDVALIQLAFPPGHIQQGIDQLNGKPPNCRFQIYVLHSPPSANGEIVELPGEFLGRLTGDAWLRLLHDAMTVAGSSGSPCFNQGWEVVAIHQGGASDAEADRKVNRAIPVAPWLKPLREIKLQAPIMWQSAVPAIDGAPSQPVIGRRRLQQRIHIAKRADASAVERLFVIKGAKGRGKTFSIRLLQHLREQGHILTVLDLEGMAGIDELRFAGVVLGALGDTGGAKPQPGLSTRDREIMNSTLPDVLGRIAALSRDRPVWLAFDGFQAAGLIENAGIGQFVDGLIAALEGHPKLRLMLTDWTRTIPDDFTAAISDLDEERERPTLEDFVDYVELMSVPPGEVMTPDQRKLVATVLGRDISALLKQSGSPGPTYYSDLLKEAKPALDLLARRG